MSLSPRAEKLISLGQRVERPTNREQVAKFLEAANIQPVEAFLRFQETYGGLQVYAAGMQELSELSLLLDPGDGQYQIGGLEDEGEWSVVVGRFENSKTMLLMDQDGIVYADTIPIADNIEKWLESHAAAAEMALGQPEWYGTAFMTVHRDDRRFDEALDADDGMPPITEATDDYTRWWGSDDLRFERSVFWEPHNQMHAIRAFARTEELVPKMLSYFVTAYGKPPPVLWWPYRMEEDGQPAAPPIK
jgi:hypothetical protein